MNEHEWRQSGADGLTHAFPAVGGFVRSMFYELPALGEVECKVTECALVVPVAYMMHQEGPHRCITCTQQHTRPYFPLGNAVTVGELCAEIASTLQDT